MKKGDLVFIYKIYVGGIEDKSQIDYVMTNISEEFKFVNSDNVVQYFIPVFDVPDHPVEVIDTKNVTTDVLSVLEELLENFYNIVKSKITYESKTN